MESVDHGDANEQRRYLHDKHSGADTNRGSQKAVPICTSGTRKSYDSVPHERDFGTSTSGRRVLIHGRRRQGSDPFGIRQAQT